MLIASNNVLTSLTKDFQGYPVLCHADLEFNNIMTIQEELVVMTQCKLHGVNSTLRIYLEGESLYIIMQNIFVPYKISFIKHFTTVRFDFWYKT